MSNLATDPCVSADSYPNSSKHLIICEILLLKITTFFHKTFSSLDISTVFYFDINNFAFDNTDILMDSMDHHPTIDLFLPLRRTSSSFLMTADDFLDDAA